MKRKIAVLLMACIVCILFCACGGSSDSDSDDKYSGTDFVKLECSVLTSYDDTVSEGTNDSGAHTYSYVPGNASDVMTEYAEYLNENYKMNFDTARGSVFVDSDGNELSLKVLPDAITLEIAIKYSN